MIRRSRVVIVICPELETTVRAVDPGVPTVLIENAPGSGDRPTPGTGDAVRASLGVAPDAPVVLYTGTFEAYQGLDLLYAAMPRVVADASGREAGAGRRRRRAGRARPHAGARARARTTRSF